MNGIVFANNNHLIDFIENKGQWANNILYQATIPNGKLFLEKDGIMFLLYNPEDVSRNHDIHHGLINNPTVEDYLINCHAYKMFFKNGNPNVTTTTLDKKTDYVNYYIGNDHSKWASKVGKFGEIIYENIYPNIDFKIYSQGTDIKYDFIVHPGGNSKDIGYYYDGLDNLELNYGRLFLSTSVNDIIDNAPVSFQNKRKIASVFKLENEIVSFEIDTYDKNEELIIDPLLVFASYSGSTSDNWGFTATYDAEGHLYAGGVAFGGGYPTTIGAFQTTFLGGSASSWNSGTDVSIMKYAPDGQTLIYSTYLGGSNSNECPHSLIVSTEKDTTTNLNSSILYILGTTSSNDFPYSIGCADSTFNGGTSVTSSGIKYANGSDIFVTKLKSDGTDIIGSTYIGGTSNDGLNLGALKYNYADDFRGEIIIDNNGNCIVASTTNSTDFPVSSGAAQTIHGGMQDGCIFKLNQDLSSIIWSTFIGGSLDDAAYGVQFNLNGEVYFAGGTKSSDFPSTVGSHKPTFAGVTDGFLTKINNTGTNFDYSTFLGTTEHDQAYFVQLDSTNNVYVVGQTEGNYPIIPNTVYNVLNSGQFLHKLTPDLSTTVFSTVIGSGQGAVDIALSAFLVNSCDQIYISGWGGVVNASNNGPIQSSTTGLPITPDAFQQTTDGSDFYLMVLSENATELKYATFFGGNTSREHVDGGTSRFDKNGIVYQAVCGGCGGNSDFPTSDGAWSETNNSSNCNIATIKFDLSVMSASGSVAEPELCAPGFATFTNQSNGGTSYLWEFGDGSTSTEASPSHVYLDTGRYTVRLIVFDPASCLYSDTSEVEVYVSSPPQITVTNEVEGCLNQSVQLEAYGTPEYSWIPTTGLSDPTIGTPTTFANIEMIYTVTGINHCGSDTEIITVTPIGDKTSISPDTNICRGEMIPIDAYGGVLYSWFDNGTIFNTNSPQALVNPTETETYDVTITDNKGCSWSKSIVVSVDTILPIIEFTDDTTICIGDNVIIEVSGGAYYTWESGVLFNSNDSTSIIASPSEYTTYRVTATNGCGSAMDLVNISVSDGPNLSVIPVVFGCPGDNVQLQSTGGTTVSWSPTQGLDNANINNPIAEVSSDKQYIITGFNNCGSKKDTVNVYVFKDSTSIEKDKAICLGQSTGIEAYGGTSYDWGPKDGTLIGSTSQTATASPTTTSTYSVDITDENNCVWSKSIKVVVDTDLPVANVSPDTAICFKDTIKIIASGGFSYEWASNYWMSNKDTNSAYVSPQQTAIFNVTVTNGCGFDTEDIKINVNKVESNTIPDTAACIGDSITLYASGGVVYLWDPIEPLDNFGTSTPSLIVTEPNLFIVKIIDALLCETTDSIYVDTLPQAYVDAGPDKLVEYGTYEPLSPTGVGTSFIWSPAAFTTCETCFYTSVSPDETMYFNITLTDENGCKATDSVLVYITGSIYVANTFTPNSDTHNDIFYAFGEEITSFKMYIFNRWGDIIFETNDINQGWDGTYNGKLCPDGTYIWKIEYTETSGYEGSMVGHVNLLK